MKTMTKVFFFIYLKKKKRKKYFFLYNLCAVTGQAGLDQLMSSLSLSNIQTIIFPIFKLFIAQ